MNPVKTLEGNREVEIPSLPSPFLKPYSFVKFRARIGFLILILIRAWRKYKSISKILKVASTLLQRFKEANDIPTMNKLAMVDGKFYWGLADPGFPSRQLEMTIENEMNRVIPFRPFEGVRIVLIAITKKCPLNCEHCFEWNNLNKPESLSLDDLVQIVNTYQEIETPQIILGGGEPMVRIKDMLELMDRIECTSDFWIYTSGFNLTTENAKKLKEAGFTGVLVSIDHHNAEKHDKFRGYQGSFETAIAACQNVREAGLVLALANCARPDFITDENIEKYMEMGQKLGASFIQFLEARSSGRYQQKIVKLTEEQIRTLKKHFLAYSTQKEYWNYPIIDWPDNLRRNIGCLAGGKRFFYIDTDGDAHSCPFCSGKVCSTLSHSPAEVIEKLKSSCCQIANFSQI